MTFVAIGALRVNVSSSDIPIPAHYMKKISIVKHLYLAGILIWQYKQKSPKYETTE